MHIMGKKSSIEMYNLHNGEENWINAVKIQMICMNKCGEASFSWNLLNLPLQLRNLLLKYTNILDKGELSLLGGEMWLLFVLQLQ